MSSAEPASSSADKTLSSIDSLCAAIDRLTARVDLLGGSGCSETLTGPEIEAITGYRLPSKQITWLKLKGWQFVTNGANHPVVGRVYARLKLAGVKPTSANAVAEAWSLDLSRVK